MLSTAFFDGAVGIYSLKINQQRHGTTAGTATAGHGRRSGFADQPHAWRPLNYRLRPGSSRVAQLPPERIWSNGSRIWRRLFKMTVCKTWQKQLLSAPNRGKRSRPRRRTVVLQQVHQMRQLESVQAYGPWPIMWNWHILTGTPALQCRNSAPLFFLVR